MQSNQRISLSALSPHCALFQSLEPDQKTRKDHKGQFSEATSTPLTYWDNHTLTQQAYHQTPNQTVWRYLHPAGTLLLFSGPDRQLHRQGLAC